MTLALFCLKNTSTFTATILQFVVNDVQALKRHSTERLTFYQTSLVFTLKGINVWKSEELKYKN